MRIEASAAAAPATTQGNSAWNAAGTWCVLESPISLARLLCADSEVFEHVFVDHPITCTSAYVSD